MGFSKFDSIVYFFFESIKGSQNPKMQFVVNINNYKFQLYEGRIVVGKASSGSSLNRFHAITVTFPYYYTCCLMSYTVLKNYCFGVFAESHIDIRIA